MTATPASAHPDLSLRPAGPADTDFLYRVFAAGRERDRLGLVRNNGLPESFAEEHLRQQFAWQTQHYQNNYPAIRFDIVLANGIPAGRLITDRGPFDFRLVDIGLLPEFRGRRFGEALVRGFCAEAGRAGKPVTLHVERDNPSLARFYAALGFVEQPHRSIQPGSHTFMEWRPPEPARKTFLLG